MKQIFENEMFNLYTGMNINSDDVIGFASPKILKGVQGYLDRPSVLESLWNKYDDKSHTTNLGMINLMSATTEEATPMLADMLKNNAVLKVRDGGRVTYDLPVPQNPDTSAKVLVDMTAELENGSIYAGVPFKVVLDKPFTAGDIVKPDPASEYQAEVSRDFPVEPYGGDGYLHYMVYQAANNSRKTFPIPYLREGQPWTKIGHKNGEMGTQFSTVQGTAAEPGHLRLQWQPSSPTTVETAITRQAALMATNSAKFLSENTIDNLYDEMIKMGGFESRGLFVSAKTTRDKDGKVSIDTRTLQIDSLLEYLAMAELHRMQSWTNIFATAYTDHGTEGVIRINDGLWRQMRRGLIVEYERPGGITLADLTTLANHYFKNSRVPDTDRYITFKGGKQAVMNGQMLVNKYALDYVNRLPTQLLGTDSLLNGSGQKLISGELNKLNLNTSVNFEAVYLPGVGNVKFVHDPSFDYNQGSMDARNSGFVGKGLGRSTYTLIVDTATSKSTNVGTKVQGLTTIQGGNENSPIYVVYPEGRPYVTWGRTQGRMHDGARFTNVQSALKYMGQEFWAIIESDVLLLDTTRCGVIELKDTYLYE